MHRVIGERGLAETPYTPDAARELLELMIHARRFDDRAIALQRRGWMSGYPPFRGQEASQIGAATAMGANDWVVPTYRQNALLLARGVPATDLLLFRRGFPEFWVDHEVPMFPQTVPIATQLPIATGLAMAAHHRDDDVAVMACLGEGATSEGDFHEAMNFAGVFDVPVVFFCENNRWAISVPADRQTASETIAVKAQAYGFEGIRVDGNDPLAVREVTEGALGRARSDEPVLVESVTYRQGAHTTADDPDRYRDGTEDLPEWRTADPIERYVGYLREENLIGDDFVERVREAAEARFANAIETVEGIAAEEPTAMFDSVYAELPPRLRAQRDRLTTRRD